MAVFTTCKLDMKGEIKVEHIIDETLLEGASPMFAKVTIPAGVELGRHQHVGNNETYYLIQGSGVYDDNGTPVEVETGDTMFCPEGTWHNITNTGAGDLVFIALIVNVPAGK